MRVGTRNAKEIMKTRELRSSRESWNDRVGVGGIAAMCGDLDGWKGGPEPHGLSNFKPV